MLVLPHNLLGPISLAACVQLDDSIPNLMAQEHNTLGAGDLKKRSFSKIALSNSPRNLAWESSWMKRL